MNPDSSVHWTAYPALGLALLIALGIGLDEAARPAFGIWITLGTIGTCTVVVGDRWSRARLVSLGPLLRLAGVAACIVAAGAARHALFRTPAPNALSHLVADPARFDASEDTEWTVRGTVSGPPQVRPRSTAFVLRVSDVLRHVQGGVAAQPAGIAVHGRIRVGLRTPRWAGDRPAYPRIRDGDRVEITARLDPLQEQRNPDGFDAAAVLGRAGICCTAAVYDPSAVRIIGPASGIRRVVAGSRTSMRERFLRSVPSPEGRAVLQALVLGDRSAIPDRSVENFRVAGLLHVLAVSGLHVFFVGLALHGLLGPVLLRLGLTWRTMERTRAGVTLAVLVGYVLLTGCRPSVVRAVVMAGCFIGGTVMQRSSVSLNALGIAAVLLLVMHPTRLFDVGFQLSFAAVAGILTLRLRLEALASASILDLERAGAPVRWVVRSTAVTVAATLATAPVLAVHFGPVPVAGVLLNLVGIPLTAGTLASGLGAAASASISGDLSLLLGAAADACAAGLLRTASVGANWLAWAHVDGGPISIWHVGSFLAALIALAQHPRPRHRWRWLVVSAALLAAGTCLPAIKGERPTLDVIFFDVGQGDAALVLSPEGHRILIDTGPGSATSSAARYAVIPFLRRRGIDRLDAVVVTHPDEDHLGGLPDILRSVSVKRVYRSGWEASTDLFRSTETLLQSHVGGVEELGAGDTLPSGNSVRIEALAPVAGEPTSSNDASVVLRLSYGRIRILFAGDIEARTERSLVSRYGVSLSSQVVKVPHHGSATSSTPPFVRAVASEEEVHAVFSLREGNRHGLPDPLVVRRWTDRGSNVHETSERGAVWIRTDGRRVWRHEW